GDFRDVLVKYAIFTQVFDRNNWSTDLNVILLMKLTTKWTRLDACNRITEICKTIDTKISSESSVGYFNPLTHHTQAPSDWLQSPHPTAPLPAAVRATGH